jgi:hypothetical protein
MNINRKIQLSAAAVIAYGASAVGLLYTTPVLAASCTDTVCFSVFHQCPANYAQYCPPHYQNCLHFLFATCGNPTNQPPCPGDVVVLCNYF